MNKFLFSSDGFQPS